MSKILILILISYNAFASGIFSCQEDMHHNDQLSYEQLCPSTTNNDEIFTIVEALIYNDQEKLNLISSDMLLPSKPMFKELVQSYEDKRIVIREFTNDEYFLKTMFKIDQIYKKNRKMYLDINTKLYDCAPSKNALISILAHELSHLQDYRKRGFFKVLGLGSRMLTKKGRSKYERLTDLYIMQNNLSLGIKEYRQWIYKRLDEKELKTKQCFYYTPSEVDLYELSNINSMKTYFKNYCRR